MYSSYNEKYVLWQFQCCSHSIASFPWCCENSNDLHEKYAQSEFNALLIGGVVRDSGRKGTILESVDEELEISKNSPVGGSCGNQGDMPSTKYERGEYELGSLTYMKKLSLVRETGKIHAEYNLDRQVLLGADVDRDFLLLVYGGFFE